MPFAPGRSLAINLLAKVVATGWFDRRYLADRLAVLAATLDAFIAGEEAMPLDQQLRLATFVIDELPVLARVGHRLRGQANAAMRFESHQTLTHRTYPAV